MFLFFMKCVFLILESSQISGGLISKSKEITPKLSINNPVLSALASSGNPNKLRVNTVTARIQESLSNDYFSNKTNRNNISVTKETQVMPLKQPYIIKNTNSSPLALPSWAVNESILDGRQAATHYDEDVSLASTPRHSKESFSLAKDGNNPLKLYKEIGLIMRWLEGVGIVLKRDDQLPIQKGESITLPVFSDGIVLCKLVQTLNRSGQIPGSVLQQPIKTNAQRLQNIRRALETLCLDKRFPFHILTLENDILNGQALAIVKILLLIKKIFKHVKV